MNNGGATNFRLKSMELTKIVATADILISSDLFWRADAEAEGELAG